jgi:hypothetical protein
MVEHLLIADVGALLLVLGLTSAPTNAGASWRGAKVKRTSAASTGNTPRA